MTRTRARGIHMTRARGIPMTRTRASPSPIHDED